MKQRRILIVEDEAIIADDLQYNLQTLGYAVTGVAMTAEDALALAEATQPDLVLMDITLRGREDGVQAARALRQRFGLPVVFLSAHSDGATIDRAGKALPLGYLVKPFTIETLRATVDTAFYRHQAEEKLRSMERWLATTLTSIGDAVVAVDPARRISFFNPAAERLTGWTRGEAVGSDYRGIVQIVRGADAAPGPDPVAEAFESGLVIHLEDGCGLRDRTGGIVPINDSAAPIRTEDTGDVAGVILILRDATTERNAEQERRSIERKMQEAQRLESLGVLAGGIAHDFNNLLTAILGNIEVAEMELPKTSTALEHLDAVKTAARRAADLCRQMLAYSGQGSYFPGKVDLTALVREAATVLRVAAAGGPELRFSLMEGIPAVNADPVQLQQVLVNLVTNAAEASTATSGPIAITTGLMQTIPGMFDQAAIAPAVMAGRYVFLEVKDAGSGMAPETVQRIWDPFFTTKFTGRGLGLSAVHGIVRTAGGAVVVQTEPGAGSLFRVYLPIATEMASAPAPRAPEREPAARESNGAWILVVDDEEPIRKLLERMTGHFGVTTVAVSSADAALAAVQVTPPPALVLLDATIPGLDTAALAALLQVTNPQVPIALMSGYVDAHTSQRFRGIEFAGFMQKPFTREAVGELLRTASRRSPR